MAFRSIEEFARIQQETPPVARYIELSWCKAKTWADWHEIRIRMLSAANAVHPYSREDADVYRTLAEVAKDHGDRVYARRLAEMAINLNVRDAHDFIRLQQKAQA